MNYFYNNISVIHNQNNIRKKIHNRRKYKFKRFKL